MDLEDGSKDFVHPEVRAHIVSLVSALGGLSVEDEGKYRLGDDALEVLRDLKRWIRFYDEKTNRMDVARCAAEAKLIEGDLLPILATWPESESENRFKARVALACFELMVPLTWPPDRDVERMTVNHHRHVPVLQMAQLGYKRAIINYDGAQILNTAARLALPAMSIPVRERTARDMGIIKLVLFFFRNVTMIEPPPGVRYDGDESQISRSATIDAFSFQDILMLLLMMSSNMGEDFGTEDAVVMEIIFHLVKRVDVEKLFMTDQELHKSRDNELSAMLAKEKSMQSSHKKGSGRHNRFGAMIWVKRDGNKMSTLSGPEALLDSATRQAKMDSTKTFRPPRRGKKEEPNVADLGLAVSLDARAKNQLRAFVDEFLDSGFNPLFQHVRKSIDLDAPHLLAHHRHQFFYLVAWFLQAERMRRKQKKPASDDNVSSFNLIAGVLSQEMFISLSRAMYGSYDTKGWALLTAAMRCLTEILRTVQEMRECGNEDDEEIAENTLARLFYEDATHDIVANVIRTHKDLGFDYLDAATELVHHFLRILEAYSKQNVDMQVRSKRRARKRRKAAAAQLEEGQDGAENAADDDDDNSGNDEASAERVTKERKFNFDRFAAKFSSQAAVDAFLAFTKFYRDLNDDQLKRAHRYFYRLCFKQELGVVLFRVDIIHLFHGMIKGPEPLDKSSAMYSEWEELCRQIIRKCIRKIQDRPQLITEMLFSKIHSTVFFLEKGYNKPVSASAPKPAAELEFRHATERNHQIGIVVAALLDKNQAELVEWIKGVLAEAEKERKAWAESNAAITAVEGEESHQPEPNPIMVRPGDDAVQHAMFKNAHLRLLMQLCDITRLAPTLDETPDSTWVIASSITPGRLMETRGFLSQAELNPPASGDSELRRKTAPRKRTAYDDDEDIMGMIDDDDGDDVDDDDMLFPAGGPTARKFIDADLAPKKTRRRRRKNDEGQKEDDEVADAEVDARRQKRREKEREKARKIKSALYVTAEDDEDDDEYDREFFAREEEIRKRAMKAAIEADAVEDGDARVLGSPSTRIRLAEEALDALLGGRSVKEIMEASKERRKRKKSPAEDVDMALDNEEDGENADDAVAQSDEESENEHETDDTPVSPSPKWPKARAARKKRRLSDGLESPPETPGYASAKQAVGGDVDGDVQMQDHEEDVPLSRPRRARVRGGIVVDSDEE